MRRLITIAFLFATSQAWAAFGYYSPISINSAQVPSTQTDFPVLVSVTDARFKSVANGGHCQTNFDIRPYTDTTLSTAITGYELVRYNASTGEVIMWVKVASLSSSTTPFVLAYGDSGITTDGSSSSAWSNNFAAVYHYEAVGTSLNLTDSSPNGVNGSGPGAPTEVAGKVGGCASFNGSSQSFTMGSTVKPAAQTVSAWVNATSLAGSFNTVFNRGVTGASVNYFALDVKSNGKLSVEVKATAALSYNGTGSHTLSTGTFYRVALSYDSSAGLIAYVNGASDGTVAANGAINTTGTQNSEVAHNVSFNCCFWNGLIDEVWVASVARAPDWLTTEYNEGFPATFETLGAEVPVTTGANGWFYFFP